MNSPGSQSPKPSLRTLRILWGALGAAILMLVVVSFVTAGTVDFDRMLPATAPDPAAAQESIFLTLGIVALVVSQVVPRLLLKMQVTRHPVMGPAHLLSPLVVRWAIGESVALFGFVLAIQAQNAAKVLPFAGVALLRHLLTFPAEAFLRNWVESSGAKWDPNAAPSSPHR